MLAIRYDSHATSGELYEGQGRLIAHKPPHGMLKGKIALVDDDNWCCDICSDEVICFHGCNILPGRLCVNINERFFLPLKHQDTQLL